MGNLETSAGFSFPRYKKCEVIEEAFQLSKMISHRLKNITKHKDQFKIYQPPAKIGTRGHLSPIDAVKTRLIYVVPFEIVGLEQQFVKPIINHLAKNPNTAIHFGEDAMPRLRDLLTRNINDRKETAYSLDWSKFDQNIPNEVIELAFNMLESHIDFTRMDCSQEVNWECDYIELTEKKSQQYRNVFRWLRWNFINQKVMLPDGRTFK